MGGVASSGFVARNIELKARLVNRPLVRKWLKVHATSGPAALAQVDTYFHCREGRLKLREQPTGAELIWYRRSNEADIRPSDYQIVDIADPAALKQLLTMACGVDTVVEKSRELWWYENVRVHLDQVRALGEFIELEGLVDAVNSEQSATEKVQWLVTQLGLTRDTWLDRSYRELLRGS